MPIGRIGGRLANEDALWLRHRVTWIDPAGNERTAILQRPAPELVEDDAFARMLVEEAALLAMLDHPGIVRLLETGEHEGFPYLILEWIESRSLAAVQRKDRVPLTLGCWIVACVARALQYAQEAKGPTGAPLRVVHRDLSPGNVRLGWDGGVRLGGFGIAKADTMRTNTLPGVLKGRFARMAPEQVLGRPVSGATDVFTLGTLLYELVSGVQPFAGNSDFETLERIRDANARPVRDLVPSLPSAIAFAIEQAHRRDPAARPSAATLAMMLEQWNATEPDPAGPRALTRHLKSLFDPESLE